MTLADIPSGSTVFVDANILIFALTSHPAHGADCDAFLDRVENQEITAVTSTHILGEVVHRMMTIEASDRFGWPIQGSPIVFAGTQPRCSSSFGQDRRWTKSTRLALVSL